MADGCEKHHSFAVAARPFDAKDFTLAKLCVQHLHTSLNIFYR